MRVPVARLRGARVLELVQRALGEARRGNGENMTKIRDSIRRFRNFLLYPTADAGWRDMDTEWQWEEDKQKVIEWCRENNNWPYHTYPCHVWTQPLEPLENGKYGLKEGYVFPGRCPSVVHQH